MSKLWDYLNKEHGLILLGSEIDDILALARKEIAIPSYDDIKEYRDKEFEASEKSGQVDADMYALGIEAGAVWAVNKVRNPYPKTIHFLKDDSIIKGKLRIIEE